MQDNLFNGVRLSLSQAEDSNNLNDYVNASYINSTLQKKLFIAASAPIKATIPDFLQLIVAPSIVVLSISEEILLGRFLTRL